MGITHAKVSEKSDGGDTSVVRPSDWNADHVISGLDVGFIGARVYNSAAESANSGEYVAVTFDSERFDTDGFHSTTSNTSRLTVPAGLSGYYQIGGSAIWTNESNAGQRLLQFKVNGSTVHRVGLTSSTQPVLNDNFPRWLNAGDYVEMFQYQDSGNNSVGVAYNTNEESPDFWVIKLDAGRVGQGVGAQAYHSTTQGSLAATTLNPLNLDSEEFDTDGFHSTTSNTSRMTIPAGLGGKYLILGKTKLDIENQIYIYKNGSVILRGGSGYTPANYYSEVTVVADLAAGDYVQLIEWHQSGTATAGDASNNHLRTELSLMRLDTSAAPVIQRPVLKPAMPTDDFDSASLSGWTAHSSQGSFATTNALTQAIDGSHVRVGYSAQMGFLYQAHGNTDLDIQLGETFSEGYNAAVMWGIAALNSSGSGVGMVMYNDGNAYLTTITSWNYPGSYLVTLVGGGLPSGGTTTTGRRWLRLVRSGNSWTGYLSFSGFAWDYTFGPSSQTYTIDKVGFGILYNTATSHYASFAAEWWHVA